MIELLRGAILKGARALFALTILAPLSIAQAAEAPATAARPSTFSSNHRIVGPGNWQNQHPSRAPVKPQPWSGHPR